MLINASLYHLLGVPPEASSQQIENAYLAARQRLDQRRRQCQRQPGLAQRVRGWLLALQAHELASARHVLLHPGRRAAYDRQLAASLLIWQYPPAH